MCYCIYSLYLLYSISIFHLIYGDNYIVANSPTHYLTNQSEGNRHLARHINQRLMNVPDEVANIDVQEQQWRMRNDPDNEHNIFVVKFGKDEEQHWRLPWNQTTNLFCHMEPNKLLIEQSRYNAEYMRLSIPPQEYKKQWFERHQKQLDKERAKQAKANGNGNSSIPLPKMTAEVSLCDTVEIKDSAKGFSRPPSARSSLAMDHQGPPDLMKRSTVRHILTPKLTPKTGPMGPMEQRQQPLKPSAIDIGSSAPTVDSAITPLTAMIAPELRALSVNRSNKNKETGNEPLKPTTKHKRRVSLASVNDANEPWHDDDESSPSDSDDDDEDDEYEDDDNGKSKFRLSVDTKSKHKDEDQVKRIDTKGNEYSVDYEARTQSIHGDRSTDDLEEKSIISANNTGSLNPNR